MSDLNLDVHIAPMRPMKGAPPQGPGDEPMWSPMSATLIHGQEEAVLVDTLVTFDQVDALADWIDGFGKRLVGIYITHGHSDHWIGLSRLRERLGDVPAWARPKVFERAVFEATNPGLSAYWRPDGVARDGQHGAGIERFDHLHDRHAGVTLAVDDRTMNRRRAAIAREAARRAR